MPTWGQILAELEETKATNNGQYNFDVVRRKYLAELHALTGRDTIIYYTDWFGSRGPATYMTLEDMQAMMEVCKGLHGPGLDLILHSPGGSPEAAASLVRYLRLRYTNIRVFVPLAAMSAATMWALASDEIVMGAHSQLGPIDPQIVIGDRQYPAQAIINQFEKAKREIKDDASQLVPWAPILREYAPSLLDQCDKAQKLARRLVGAWLRSYMFSGRPDRLRVARAAAAYFSDYARHQSHSMGIGRDDARKKQIVVTDLEADAALQDAVLSVHHTTMHTFGGPAVKIVENHRGKAFVKSEQVQTIQLPIGIPIRPQP